MADENGNVNMQTSRLELEGMAEIREGVYANIALARTSPKESILDFAFIDSNEHDAGGNMVTKGKFQARIVMANSSLVELRDMLDKHIAQHVQNFPLGGMAN